MLILLMLLVVVVQVISLHMLLSLLVALLWPCDYNGLFSSTLDVVEVRDAGLSMGKAPWVGLQEAHMTLRFKV
jgi:hypothetical protein